MKLNKKSVLIFIGPSLLFILIVFLFPVIKTTLMSFFDVRMINSPISTWSFSGLTNYFKLFNTRMFLVSLINIGKIWLLCGIATFVLAMLFSVILTSGIKGQKFFRAFIYMPNIIAAVAVGYMWLLYVFNPQFGLMTSLFKLLHIESLASFNWLSTDNIFTAMCIAYVFSNVGYYMLMYIAGIEKIPVDYYEAATIEGANSVVKFLKITMPLLVPVLSSSLVLWTSRVMGFFALSQVFTSTSTYTPLVFTYDMLFGSELSAGTISAGVAAASALIMTLTVLIISSLSRRFIRTEQYDL